MRANRADTGATSWTYNHAPMLAYWNNNFYLEYLSNPVGEHVGKGTNLIADFKRWVQLECTCNHLSAIPLTDGTVKEGRKDSAKNAFAVMHQRIGFYTSKSKRLFALAYYGIVLGQKDDPNDGNGIGRVIREIKADGSFGPIYFLRTIMHLMKKTLCIHFIKHQKIKILLLPVKKF
jgi:hypothetical protein